MRSGASPRSTRARSSPRSAPRRSWTPAPPRRTARASTGAAGKARVPRSSSGFPTATSCTTTAATCTTSTASSRPTCPPRASSNMCRSAARGRPIRRPARSARCCRAAASTSTSPPRRSGQEPAGRLHQRRLLALRHGEPARPAVLDGGVGAAASCAGGGCQPIVAGNFAGFLSGPGAAGMGLDYFFNTRTGVIEGVVGYRRCAAPGAC